FKMKTDKLIKIVNNFSGKKIGVIGDLMLDHFMWGDVERISPEAPIPVVLVEKESFSPGGAGNTAANIAALKGETFIVGLVGCDQAGDFLFREFQKRGIKTSGVIRDSLKPTTQKIRVVARGQQMVRIDKEDNGCINAKIERKIINFINLNIKQWQALVISDYDKGLLNKELVQKIMKLAKKHKIPTIGDARPKNAIFFKNITLLTPNHKEAVEIAGTNNLREAGRIIQKKLNCDILITQGAEGMTLFEKNRIQHFSTKAREVFDVAGAGDTVVAILALALATGSSLKEAAIISNHAAGIVVGKLGVATVNQKELKDSLKNE
ncbi:D-glycero-beta-D-manno-heptose-7-phosphate kinase, partial [Patescibacteria group bacterium]|nr:D-glycero-beta-D-manno-heptose-7-phosphate kinase [Patescibacteria group bacterium]